MNGRDVDPALVFRADGAIPVFTLRVKRAFSGNTDPLRAGREIEKADGPRFVRIVCTRSEDKGFSAGPFVKYCAPG